MTLRSYQFQLMCIYIIHILVCLMFYVLFILIRSICVARCAANAALSPLPYTMPPVSEID